MYVCICVIYIFLILIMSIPTLYFFVEVFYLNKIIPGKKKNL